MKIGILTYQKTTNYGAIFQCYALQKFINDNFTECEVIDYNNKIIKERYDINPLHSKNIKELFKKIITYNSNRKLKKYFSNFTKEYIKISKEKYDENTIKEADKVYDSFIMGSDQIWNLELSGKDLNYFCVFTDDYKKRNSYAASMGTVQLKEEYREKFDSAIKMQNNISVREAEAQNYILERFKNLEINQNIDPVFLIEKDDWKKIINKKEYKEKYIFVYEVAHTENLRCFAQKLSKLTGYKIYFVSNSLKNISGAKKIKDATPQEFLSYIYNAEYVVTSSFHGMALSIIFEKKFFYDLPSSKKQNFGSRLKSLGELLEVTDREINGDKDIYGDINYQFVNKKIKKEIEKSRKYLEKFVREL